MVCISLDLASGERLPWWKLWCICLSNTNAPTGPEVEYIIWFNNVPITDIISKLYVIFTMVYIFLAELKKPFRLPGAPDILVVTDSNSSHDQYSIMINKKGYYYQQAGSTGETALFPIADIHDKGCNALFLDGRVNWHQTRQLDIDDFLGILILMSAMK